MSPQSIEGDVILDFIYWNCDTYSIELMEYGHTCTHTPITYLVVASTIFSCGFTLGIVLGVGVAQRTKSDSMVEGCLDITLSYYQIPV